MLQMYFLKQIKLKINDGKYKNINLIIDVDIFL